MRRYMKIAALVTALVCLLFTAAAYAETVTAMIDVRLTLSGSTPQKASNFTFVLQPNDKKNPMPDEDTLVIRGAGEGSFGPISFEEPNTYTYTLYQTDGKVNGYTYDNIVYTVTIQITSDAQGKLTASVSMCGDDGSKAGIATFKNKYENNTEIPKTGYDDEDNWLVSLAKEYLSRLQQ